VAWQRSTSVLAQGASRFSLAGRLGVPAIGSITGKWPACLAAACSDGRGPSETSDIHSTTGENSNSRGYRLCRGASHTSSLILMRISSLPEIPFKDLERGAFQKLSSVETSNREPSSAREGKKTRSIDKTFGATQNVRTLGYESQKPARKDA